MRPDRVLFGICTMRRHREPSGNSCAFMLDAQSWEDISGNLPDAPLTSIVVDNRPAYAGGYVGGSLGVWVLQAGSDEWLPFGTGMPFAIVTDLELNRDTGVMVAATWGRSTWLMDMP